MRSSTLDSGPNRIDSARFDTLPDFSLPEVAWMAGVAEEAMRSYLEEANAAWNDVDITMPNLVRAAFTLLGRKENQSSMLRLQLVNALERERELSETLRAGLLGSGIPTASVSPPVQTPSPPPAPTPVAPPAPTPVAQPPAPPPPAPVATAPVVRPVALPAPARSTKVAEEKKSVTNKKKKK
ncbi:MAG: hypothetical protein H7839_03375 [Magnetococcus sp. YQC-5]